MKTLISLVLFFVTSLTLASDVPAVFAQKGIKVLSQAKGVGGLNVWYVQKGKTTTVLYTTPDNKVLLSGVLWDAGTGANLSDAYILPTMVVAEAEKTMFSQQTLPQAQNTSSDLPANYFNANKMSDAIKGIATLTGIKEGNAAIEKTLYIMFDPRCPYCHSVFAKTRSYVKNGGSIKWIPISVLGDRERGMRMIADILQAKNPQTKLAEVMGGGNTVGSELSATLRKEVDQNEAYFFAAFEKNKGAGESGVPVAFFQKSGGGPQMVSGIDDDALLKRIFTDIK